MGHKLKQNKVVNSRTDFFYYMFRNILLFGIPLLIISGLVLPHLSFHSAATSSGTDRIEFSLSVSCTLSSIVDNEHSTNITNGTYVSGIGKTTVTTLCNDGNGYAVYANGYSNDEEGNNKLINSSSPQNSIDTGLATSGLTSAWAMRLDNVLDDPTPPTITNDYNATYGLIPTYYTKVAEKASGTTNMSQGSSFTTTYAIYASSSQYTGTYVGQVKYMLTHPSYKPVVYYMQEVDSWKNNLAMEESVQAIDKRDGKSYWVTKLKDGNIWMTQNLDFDIDSSAVLNSTTTDLNVIYNSTNGQYPEYNAGYTKNDSIIYWAPANSATTIDFTGTTVTNWQSSNIVPYSASKTDDANTEHASLGNYYNWTAAIASNYSSTLTSNTINNISQNPQNSICPKGWRLPTVSSDNVSIAGSTNDFARLNYLYNANSNNNSDMLKTPLFFKISGYIDSTNQKKPTTDGYYWSSSINNNNNAYNLSLYSGQINASDSLLRYYGFSVRCIAH